MHHIDNLTHVDNSGHTNMPLRLVTMVTGHTQTARLLARDYLVAAHTNSVTEEQEAAVRG